jgi:isocitrate lyase
MELSVLAPAGEVEANVVFAPMEDRQGKHILSVRDQNTFNPDLRKKRLMTLTHLWLVHRYRTDSVHYVSPTDDNRYQAQKMKTHGLYREVHEEVGHIIVANVNPERVRELLQSDREALGRLIRKEEPVGSEVADAGVGVAAPSRS